jgi:photosystem II stability/assembly factor-like uncharacterized protein
MNFTVKIALGIILMSLGYWAIGISKKAVTIKEHYPAPTEKTKVREGQVEGQTEGNPREEWQEMMHRTAPDTDWRTIEKENMLATYRHRKQLMSQVNNRTVESLAGGNLMGEWQEKGSNNQAGNLTAVDFDSVTDEVYAIAPGGTLWKSDLGMSNWTTLNDDLLFDSKILQITYIGSNRRIISAIGKDIYYSDDEGVNWTPSGGITYDQAWGNSIKIMKVNDANNTIYYLVKTWNNTAWQGEIWLYASTNNGTSFNKIHTFTHSNDNNIDFWTPFNSNEAYLLDQDSRLYTMDATGLTLMHTTSLSTNIWRRLTGSQSGGTLIFYAMLNRKDVYKSSDNGTTWTLTGSVPQNAWSVGIEASPWDSDNVFMGEVDFYRSENGGSTWSPVNYWYQYYSNIDRLHADIITMSMHEKSDGTPFVLVGNHGGLHVSYDELQSTENISKLNLNNAEYYDVRTDPNNSSYIYAGAQDQGWQRTSNGNVPGTNSFAQVISGDYGHLCLTNNGQSLWTVYPFGNINFYSNAQTGYSDALTDLDGTDAPVSNWIWPTSETYNTASNDIYIAGGNINGGAGAHLITLSAVQSGGSWSINESQFSYDFKANSTTGTGTISAIEPSYINPNRIYVGMSDGSFFYTNDGGATWTKSSDIVPGQFYLYGASIYASKLNPDLVWMAGSGYNNASVYKSTDGGQTFTAMANGLPNTLVHEITANPDETLLFAAAESGAYVYVTAEDTWYDMMGTAAPQQKYYSVEYVNSNDLVRYGTYGRGIWDFAIAAQPVLPVEWLSFEAKVVDNQRIVLNWTTASEFENDYFSIERSADGKDFEIIGEVASLGAAVKEQGYEFTDDFPLLGDNYYRLKQVDRNGDFEYSEIALGVIKGDQPIATIFPNPVTSGENLQVKISKNGVFNYTIFNTNGQVVKSASIDENAQIEMTDMPAGNYFYQINGENETTQFNGKLMVSPR